MKKIEFPEGFFWGTATSAHQVEGDNKLNDWWQWEQTRDGDRSGAACRHYDLFKIDFDIARSLNTNMHRFSIEWSRVEPEKGKWDNFQIDHYHEVIDALRTRGIEPVITLHHFTNPVWVSEEGGWESPGTVEYFERFAKKMAEEFSGKVRWWITINEPVVFVNAGYMFGYWVPQVKDAKRGFKVFRNLIDAHCRVYEGIHKIAGLLDNEVEVGISKAFIHFTPKNKSSFLDRWATFWQDVYYNHLFMKSIMGGAGALWSLIIGKAPVYKKHADFIGLNYYLQDFVRYDGFGISLNKLKGAVCTWEDKSLIKGRELNYLGWLVAPEGIYYALKSCRRYKLPILITENGICDKEGDEQRIRFIKNHLYNIWRAIKEKVNVIGYTYWSLLDNFEWAEGYAPRFGLVEVDYDTYKRTLKESAKEYAQICKDGFFEYEDAGE